MSHVNVVTLGLLLFVACLVAIVTRRLDTEMDLAPATSGMEQAFEVSRVVGLQLTLCSTEKNRHGALSRHLRVNFTN